MDVTYTHKDLAKQLNVSETTIKSYRRKFPGCIPVSSQGKPIRFNAQALQVARKIRDLFEQGMNVEEVRSRLSEEFAWIEPAGAPKVLPAPEKADALESAPKEGVVISPRFANAIGGLAKSVVALTRQQGEILDRLCRLEENLKVSFQTLPSQAGSGPEEENSPAPEPADTAENICPPWAGELASRLQEMEKTLARTLESLEAGLKTAQPEAAGGQEESGISPEAFSAPPAPPAVEAGGENAQTQTPEKMPAPEPAPVQTAPAAQSAPPEGARVLAWNGHTPTGEAEQNEHPAAEGQGMSLNISDDYLRQLSALPLVVQSGGELVGIAGRGPFCLNDMKAVLSQTFAPPHHYVGRWETASGELWYILEQPEAVNAQTISLHLAPVTSRRNRPFVEVVRFMLGQASEEPASLYAFAQQLLG